MWTSFVQFHPSGGDAMPGSTANQGHGVVLLALGQVLDAELTSPKRGLGACGPGEVVGGIDLSIRRTKSLLDRPVCSVQAAWLSERESSHSTGSREWKEVP
jgi:hypothetical protein